MEAFHEQGTRLGVLIEPAKACRLLAAFDQARELSREWQEGSTIDTTAAAVLCSGRIMPISAYVLVFSARQWWMG